MCFSASASFIAGGAIGTFGVATLKKVKRNEFLLALIPILFAVQQLSEGFVWMSLHNGKVSLFAAYIFVAFAYVIWPVYIPLALYVLQKKTRKIMQWFLLLGIVTAAIAFFVLISEPLDVHIVERHINYGITLPLPIFANALYCIAIFGALFVSHKSVLRLLALIVLIAAAAAAIISYVTAASVWCFFAALASVLVDVYLRHHRIG